MDLVLRDIIGDAESAPATFTSWDKCMQKAYCKWPAIIGIVVASLIVLSLLFCIVQCLCCGYSCMQAICCCCKCGRGGSRNRDRPSRYRDDYAQMPPTPYNGYQPTPAPMMYSGPQTATFDANPNRKIHEDSLPAMPTWDTARTHRVEDYSQDHKTEDLEMGRLAAPTGQPNRISRGNGYSQVAQHPASPTSPAFGGANTSYFGQSAPMHAQSDLGSQRIGHDPYHEFEDQPLSPPPTYLSNPQTGNSDRFAPGAASPQPNQFQNHSQHHFSDAHTGYAPSGSTQYEATEYAPTYHTSQSPPRAMSPPQLNGGYQPYGGQVTSPKDARPPSLLQVGRKAVPGSVREV